jgi:hypothetical protein
MSGQAAAKKRGRVSAVPGRESLEASKKWTEGGTRAEGEQVESKEMKEEVGEELTQLRRVLRVNASTVNDARLLRDLGRDVGREVLADVSVRVLRLRSIGASIRAMTM